MSVIGHYDISRFWLAHSRTIHKYQYHVSSFDISSEPPRAHQNESQLLKTSRRIIVWFLYSTNDHKAILNGDTHDKPTISQRLNSFNNGWACCFERKNVTRRIIVWSLYSTKDHKVIINGDTHDKFTINWRLNSF